MKMEKKLSSKKEEIKDQLIEQYKTTIHELIDKVDKLEKKIKQMVRR